MQHSQPPNVGADLADVRWWGVKISYAPLTLYQQVQQQCSKYLSQQPSFYIHDFTAVGRSRYTSTGDLQSKALDCIQLLD